MRLRGVLIATFAGLVLLSAVAMSWPVQDPRTFSTDRFAGVRFCIAVNYLVYSMTR